MNVIIIKLLIHILNGLLFLQVSALELLQISGLQDLVMIGVGTCLG